MARSIVIIASLWCFMSVAVHAPHTTAPVAGEWMGFELRQSARMLIYVHSETLAFIKVVDGSRKIRLIGNVAGDGRAVFFYGHSTSQPRLAYSGTLDGRDTLAGKTYVILDERDGGGFMVLEFWKATRVK